MSGLRSVEQKRRRAVRRINHVAKDLRLPQYGPRIRDTNRKHLIDELHEEEAEDEIYDFYHEDKELGLTSKE